MYHIENTQISLMVSSKGAELQSLLLKNRGREYLWQGDSQYWGRRAPILFPIVGKLREGKYRYQGQEYSLGQHGFARDLPFSMIKHTENELMFELVDNEQTRAIYPFSFSLTVRYVLCEATVTVEWQVENRSDQPLFYSIGAHPAFNIPLYSEDYLEDCRFKIEGANICQYSFRHGFLDPTPRLALTEFTFGEAKFAGHDTIIYSTPARTTVTLSDSREHHFVRVTYDNMSHLGIWPPVGKAPFVCIEPWAGVLDRFDSTGDLEKKYAICQLSAFGGDFYRYQIQLN